MQVGGFLALEEAQRGAADRVVVLAQVWLDRPEVLDALHTVLSGEEEEDEEEEEGEEEEEEEEEEGEQRRVCVYMFRVRRGGVGHVLRGGWRLECAYVRRKICGRIGRCEARLGRLACMGWVGGWVGE